MDNERSKPSTITIFGITISTTLALALLVFIVVLALSPPLCYMLPGSSYGRGGKFCVFGS